MTREVRVRPRLTDEEYEVKLNHIIRFLENGAQVKLSVMFKGKDVNHPEPGEKLLLEFVKGLEKYAKTEWPPFFDGRQMSLVFTPKVQPAQ